MNERLVFGKSLFQWVFTIFFIVLVFLIVVLKITELFIPEDIKIYFVTLVAAFAGGLCTLFGVLFTIRSTQNLELEKKIEMYKPNVFVPQLYDITNAIYISVKNKHHKNAIPNIKIPLKNSDKISFAIEKIMVENNSDNYCFESSVCVNKNELFFVNFYSKEKVENVALVLKSNDYFYKCTIKLNNKIPEMVMVENYAGYKNK